MRNEAINIYYNAYYTELRIQIQVKGLFSSNERPQHHEPFELDNHAILDGAQLSFEEKKVQIMFNKHNRIFSRSSTDLGFSDKIRHKMQLNDDPMPFRRANGSMNFERQETMKDYRNCTLTLCNRIYPSAFALDNGSWVSYAKQLMLIRIPKRIRGTGKKYASLSSFDNAGGGLLTDKDLRENLF